jgi:hypothetical protein
VAGNLSLELPVFTVGVKDSVAKEITEALDKRGTFAVAREIGFENVLDHSRVSCEDLAGAECTVEDEGGGRDGLEDVGDPLDATVEIGCQRKSRTEDGVRFGDGGGGCFWGF